MDTMGAWLGGYHIHIRIRTLPKGTGTKGPLVDGKLVSGSHQGTWFGMSVDQISYRLGPFFWEEITWAGFDREKRAFFSLLQCLGEFHKFTVTPKKSMDQGDYVRCMPHS